MKSQSEIIKVNLNSVKALVNEVLKKVLVDQDTIDIVLDTMLYADRRGLTSHGVGRLPLYVRKIQSGHLNPLNEIESILDYEAISILDAHNGFGQIAAKQAVEMGIKKAKKHGISAVAVRNSNNFGVAGYFGHLAATQHMAAMIFANASPAIAPTGGTKPLLGTNPICFSFPKGESKEPVVFDMATSIVARGKIRLAAKNGEKIPYTWAINENGELTDDPAEAMKGTLLPAGG